MRVVVGDKKFAKVLDDDREMNKVYGDRIGRKIRRRLEQMLSAETLESLRYQGGRCHELKGNRQGQLATDLSHPHRLIFAPLPPIPLRNDGGLDWKKVTEIRIIEITDYH